jgi:hypothetical protein
MIFNDIFGKFINFFIIWLILLFIYCSFDYYLFILVKEDTVLDMVLTMTENVGLVHQMPYASTRRGFSSHMEKVNIDTCRINPYCRRSYGHRHNLSILQEKLWS